MKNPTKDKKGFARVVRGGGWYYWAEDTRVSKYDRTTSSSEYAILGFRIVRNKQ